MALGAQQRAVIGMVLRDTGVMVAAGIAIGVPSALALGRVARRVLDPVLFGVQPGDPLVFAGTAMLLLVVAMVAAFLPARAAAGVDPMIALPRE